MKQKLKKILFALVPVLVFAVVADVGMWLIGPDSIRDDRYFGGFPGTPAFYEVDEGPQGRAEYVAREGSGLHDRRFAVEKQENVVRIFTLGGSSVWGDPYGPEGAFSSWLEKRLSALVPGKTIEVLNSGRKGYGSVRVENIFNEIIQYNPDLVIVYFGNNERRDHNFHRAEILFERSALKSVKSVLDHSSIFRLAFHVLLKKKIDSYGAQSIKNVISRSYDRNKTFSWEVRHVEKIRSKLPKNLGGDWDNSVTLASLSEQHVEEYKDSLIKKDILAKPLQETFRGSVERIIQKSQDAGVPVLFLTRSRNFYYNRLEQELFAKFDSANNIVKECCEHAGVPCLEALDFLSKHFGGEREDVGLGYDAFIDTVHPTLRMHQAVGKMTSEFLLQHKPFVRRVTRGSESEALSSADRSVITAKRDENDRVERETFSTDSRTLSKIGWQALALFDQSEGREAAVARVSDVANRAIELEPSNGHGYLLLGALFTLERDFEEAETVWKRMYDQFTALR